jgi:hypothetical protein
MDRFRMLSLRAFQARLEVYWEVLDKQSCACVTPIDLTLTEFEPSLTVSAPASDFVIHCERCLRFLSVQGTLFPQGMSALGRVVDRNCT